MQLPTFLFYIFLVTSLTHARYIPLAHNGKTYIVEYSYGPYTEPPKSSSKAVVVSDMDQLPKDVQASLRSQLVALDNVVKVAKESYQRDNYIDKRITSRMEEIEERRSEKRVSSKLKQLEEKSQTQQPTTTPTLKTAVFRSPPSSTSGVATKVKSVPEPSEANLASLISSFSALYIGLFMFALFA